MKKIFLTTAAVLITVLFVSANTGTVYKVTIKSRKQLRKERREIRRETWLHSVNNETEYQFNADFPMATNVTWTEGAFAEATFNDGKILKTAYYDYDNQLVGTTTIVDFSVLPQKARDFIAEKYPGASVEKVVLFDDNEANDTDMYLFNRSFEDQDNYFPLLKEGSKEIILKVSMDGSVDFFRDFK